MSTQMVASVESSTGVKFMMNIVIEGETINMLQKCVYSPQKDADGNPYKKPAKVGKTTEWSGTVSKLGKVSMKHKSEKLDGMIPFNCEDSFDLKYTNSNGDTKTWVFTCD